MEAGEMQKPKRAAIYVRVSTSGQSTQAQESELKAYAKQRGWTLTRVFADNGVSGAQNSRPALDSMMADCRRGKIDVVLVTRFDRFARSVTHLLSALEAFKEMGVEFVSLSESIDTSTPAGKMVFTVLAAVGELEKSLIAERVRSGLANARRHGTRLGRPAIRTLCQLEIEKVRADRASGKFSLRQLARKYGTSLWAMQRATARKNAGI
jgi:DNA invertase Pin-like site-specific DNA recombinase